MVLLNVCGVTSYVIIQRVQRDTIWVVTLRISRVCTPMVIRRDQGITVVAEIPRRRGRNKY